MNYKKPFFKTLLNSNIICVRNYKIFNFKKNKWVKFLMVYKNYLIGSKFKKFSLIDHTKLLINNYSNKYNSYKNIYSFFFNSLKNIKFFYFNSLNKKLVKNIYLNNFLNFLERRLNIILIRIKLCLTLNISKHFIKKGYIFINKNKIKICNYIINSGNFIKINIYSQIYNKLLIYCFKWPIPLNHLIINYISKEFLFLNFIFSINLTLYFPYYLRLKNIFY